MNIEQAKKYINEALNITVYSHYKHSATCNDIHKLLTLALHDLESPAIKKSNGYCSKCLWPDTRCQCEPKFVTVPEQWDPVACKKGPAPASRMHIVAEDMLIETSPGPRNMWSGLRPDRVKVTHKPTGISYSFSTERTQHANKQKAWDKLIRELKARGWLDLITYSTNHEQD